MADIDLVLTRIASDPAFAAHLRTDPRSTLSGYELSDADFARVEQAVSGLHPPTPAAGVGSLFAPTTADDPVPPAATSSTPRHRRPLQAALGAALLVGAVTGFWLGHADAGPDPAPPSAAGTSRHLAAATVVAYSACPGDTGASHIGDFHRGDQLWVVGRDATGGWLQVRSPAGERVWVARSTVTAADTEHLAVVTCDLGGSAPSASTPVDGGTAVAGTDPPAPGGPTTSTTTTSTIAGGGPSTTPPPTRPTVSVAPGDPTPSTPVPSPTTAPPGPGTPADRDGPSVQKVGATPPDIWEHYSAGGGRCVSQTSSIVTASVTDPSGVASVQVDWIVAGAGGAHGTALTSHSGPTWSATVGPVEWHDGAVPAGGADITVTVRAVDGAGNASTATTTLHLHSAQECIG